VQRPLRIVRVVDQEASFLQFLDRNGLTPGVGVTVQTRDPHADGVLLKVQNKPPVSLGTAAAAKIWVEPV